MRYHSRPCRPTAKAEREQYRHHNDNDPDHAPGPPFFDRNRQRISLTVNGRTKPVRLVISATTRRNVQRGDYYPAALAALSLTKGWTFN